MNRLTDKFWFAWGLAAIFGLLVVSTVASGQDSVNPRNNWLEVGPQQLQPENVGMVFPGPLLEPGPHMVWLATRVNDTSLPYTTWHSYGPFDVLPGHKYLVTVRGSLIPAVGFRALGIHPIDNANPSPAASVHYLNLTEGDAIYGISVVPMIGSPPKMFVLDRLASDDPKDARHGCPHRMYPVMLEQGKTYIIEMRSDTFDTWLMIENDRGELLAQNDEDSTVFTVRAMNSRITFRPNETGTYRLVAMPFAASGEGNFTMTVREVPVMMRIEDVLTPADEVRNDCFAKTYDVTMIAGRRYYIDLESTGFATYMQLLNSAGVVVAVDDGGGMGMNTRIAFQPPDTGAYRIVATSFDSGISGPFALTVREEE